MSPWPSGRVLRRRLPATLALGLGLLALGWVLWTLQRIFSEERHLFREQERIRTEAVEGYASEKLRQALAAQLQHQLPQLQRSLEDPLQPSNGFFVSYRGIQFLPRISRAKPGQATPVQAAWSELQSRSSRFHPRLAALAEAERTGQVLPLLKLHAASPLPKAEELAFLFLMTERLSAQGSTRAEALTLLREGLPEDAGGMSRSRGLQRDLLLARSKLSRSDFQFLSERVLQLSQTLGVPTAPFLARLDDEDQGLLVLPEVPFDEPVLLGQRWYLEPSQGVIRGVAVDLPKTVRDVTVSLQRDNVFGSQSSLALSSKASIEHASTLHLTLTAPPWVENARSVEGRFWLKSLLVLLCGALALAMAVLTFLTQRRKEHFLQLRTRFVSTVSHELRTPLSSIQLLAETLERRLPESSEERSYARHLLDAAGGLQAKVENILSFNRLEKGRWPLTLGSVPLEELAAELRLRLPELSRLPIVLRCDLGDAAVMGDAALLLLLLENLTRNAVLYNRRQPVEVALKAHAPEGGPVTVLVSDNGVGIPEAEWDLIFHDFYRLDRPDLPAAGTGLGLALCRRIMEAHHGQIRVALSGSNGTTFALTFPVP